MKCSPLLPVLRRAKAFASTEQLKLPTWLQNAVWAELNGFSPAPLPSPLASPEAYEDVRQSNIVHTFMTHRA